MALLSLAPVCTGGLFCVASAAYAAWISTRKKRVKKVQMKFQSLTLKLKYSSMYTANCQSLQSNFPGFFPAPGKEFLRPSLMRCDTLSQWCKKREITCTRYCNNMTFSEGFDAGKIIFKTCSDCVDRDLNQMTGHPECSYNPGGRKRQAFLYSATANISGYS